MGRFQDCSAAAAGGCPSQERVTEEAYFGACAKKTMYSQAGLSYFNPVSGTDMGGEIVLSN